MLRRKSSSKASQKSSSDIETGTKKDSKEIPSLHGSVHGYRIVSQNTKKTRKSPPTSKQPHNPAVIESTRRALEYTRKANAADKIKNKWREYTRRHPKKSIFKKMFDVASSYASKTFSRLSMVKGGKKTRKQKR